MPVRSILENNVPGMWEHVRPRHFDSSDNAEATGKTVSRYLALQALTIALVTMAHRVHRDMDKKSYFNKLFTRITKTENKHLKPLSVYSRMEAHNQGGSHQSEIFSRPFVNFKIEVVNNYMNKRKLDESILNHGSPVKKIYSPNAMSPDLGCFMDYSGPLAKKDSLSPSAFSYPALYEKTQVYMDKITMTRSSLQHLEQEECGSSSGNGDEVEAVEWRSKSEKMLSNLSPAFDADVDDILCLSPISQEDLKEVNEQLKADLAEEDKGYLSTSDVNYIKEVCHSDISSDPQGHEQAPTYGRCFSSKQRLNAAVEEPLSEHMNFPLECFEGEVGEAWNIGMPIFESSICQSDAGIENRTQMSGDPKKTNVYLDHCGLNFTPEVTFPLQVKSEWVNSSEHNNISKQVPSCREEKPSAGIKNKDKTVNNAKRPRIQRQTIFNNSKEWEEQKRQYVRSVTNHMTENQGAHGLMTELLDLMNHVDRQTGSNGPQWQHPSDLTCRNYQRMFDNKTPTLTLSEWQAKNCIKHKRFCKVPKIFERSPFP